MVGTRTIRLIAAVFTTLALAVSLVVTSGGLNAAQAHPKYHPWGKVTAPDQKLKPGCRLYTYSYRENAPTKYWSLEIFLINPNGHVIKTEALDAGADPSHKTRHFSTSLCRANTVPGRYKLKMKVTYCQAYDCYSETPRHGFVRPSYFRLTKPQGHYIRVGK